MSPSGSRGMVRLVLVSPSAWPEDGVPVTHLHGNRQKFACVMTSSGTPSGSPASVASLPRRSDDHLSPGVWPLMLAK